MTSLEYSLKLQRASDGIEVSGNVSAFQIKEEQPALSSASFSLATPFIFNGQLTNHNLSLRPFKGSQSLPGDACLDSTETVLSIVNKDLVIFPEKLSIGLTWQDSTTSTACSGSIPVVVSTISDFQVTGAVTLDGIDALTVNRTERFSIVGEGSQGQHQIGINGTGTGKGQALIDRSTGSLLSLTTINQTELSIKSSGRIQSFIQTSEETTKRKPPL